MVVFSKARLSLVGYICLVIVPNHIVPVFFWNTIYFYYGAYVNSSYGNVSEWMNNVENILDSIKTQFFKENLLGKERGNTQVEGC